MAEPKSQFRNARLKDNILKKPKNINQYIYIYTYNKINEQL